MTKGIDQHKYLFHKGKNYRAYEFLGVHRAQEGYVFRVWAPRAAAISLVGDFNEWDLNAQPMERLSDDDSIWETVCNAVQPGDRYKFAVHTDKGDILYKADPYAFAAEKTPFTEGGQRASVVADFDEPFDWQDQDYLAMRNSRNPYTSPMNIYEVHAGSWRYREDGTPMQLKDLAGELVPYVKEMGYTHIELLPIMDHPYAGSWGYQITGYYSVAPVYGTANDLRTLIDAAHREGIGVILDWVPAHFPKDAHGPATFDGYPLYEYDDILKREHKGWGTYAFDLGRPEVVSFLMSNAYYYCDRFHVDGLRVDAVSAMLYLNYGREFGEWYPNEDGGTENKEAIAFLQTLNQHVLTEYPGVMMIAEESTAFPNITKPPSVGGLGFNFKWNMGWVNDVLEYFSTDPLFRKGVHTKLTFPITYAYSENFILPFSHDEAVHGKCSLLNKMPGEYDDKFAGFKAFMIYMMTHPGKKMLFMGTEFAQFIEWNEKRELDWLLLLYDKHRMTRDFVRELNHLYLDTEPFWCQDDSFDSFRWIDADNASDNVYTYLRLKTIGEKPEKLPVYLVVLNLSGRDFPAYDIGVPADRGECSLLIDTEEKAFGGSGRRDEVSEIKEGYVNGYEQHITIRLPHLSGAIYKLTACNRQSDKTRRE